MVESFFGGGGGSGSGGWGGQGNGQPWNFKSLFDMKDISEKTRAHLTRVYTTLMVGVGTCAAGMYINTYFVLQGFLVMLLFMIGMAYLIMQVKNPSLPENTQIAYMLFASFLMGFMVGPGINHIAEVAPELLMQAVLYSGTAFGSFSALSLFSARRSYLFLGGIIATMMQVMFFYNMAGWLFGAGSMFGLGYLMCGLFICCLWIIFDT